ncbi:hypothetical protein OG369_40615 [Streptomyces sp. NBC_01221]|uniref:hypothetical protein n=1 Tax=unclassified Streptomyces TaxID=2593676 RepID=UPI00225103E3|nr:MULTISPECIES: hypothetical protein [unclassified Streptomyces]WSP53190.1 hypothetical protein OG306_01160 [Streptomyces sp. NBC_01241]WSU26098.1 hypothetical protein OG508_37885 [Streptomyces sp. NBC_01108]MCX4792135.1 hypothetical protein [Streptomyces sp. NBC_01221]MCX4799523.1 hypothetical protein [Streptomyces sp. NBC_01242]WSJ40653.1 hypothetical protein OG772_35075 [Streptomyces sp. NBC_01321]
MAPARDFRWAKDGVSFAGWHYCATARDDVGYETWLERDHLILMGRDPEVVGVTSQPFCAGRMALGLTPALASAW